MLNICKEQPTTSAYNHSPAVTREDSSSYLSIFQTEENLLSYITFLTKHYEKYQIAQHTQSLQQELEIDLDIFFFFFNWQSIFQFSFLSFQ